MPSSQSTRQSTPQSVPPGTIPEDPEPAKKSRKRKTAEKKPLPRSSTLHGLWGLKPVEQGSAGQGPVGERVCEDRGEGRGVLVFKVAPEKLSAVVLGVQNAEARMITPPRSLSDTVVAGPETPEKQNSDSSIMMPDLEGEGPGDGVLQQSPPENVQQSPRNRRSSFNALVFPEIAPQPAVAITPRVVPIAPRSVPIAPKPADVAPKPKAPHPFFLGKEARISIYVSELTLGHALQATAAPAMTTTLSETGEPSRKRQKSVSSDQTVSETPTLLPAKPIQSSSKSFHPFFMSRTVSVDSNISVASMPLLPLPQGKKVYLGNGKPAAFPPKGMNHIHDNPAHQARIERHMTLKQRKGKATLHNHHGSYSSLANIYKSVDFIPPERTTYPKSQIQDLAKQVLSPNCHHALLRAYKILCNEDRTKDPDGIAWTYKFRPRRSDEILCGNDAGLQLRNWMAGDRKLVHPTTSSIPAEMEDFIVDDDGDGDYTDDSISEVDTPRKPKRKKVFNAYENVVILVGNHGVGKSSAVYAVAEEMGYQVFEISPGSKRGAREIFEAVGEVGQSELVTKHKAINTAPDLSPVEDALESRKGRKGLICFEEVDILYEDDKSFWSGVSNLVEKSSRRPVILTCNGIYSPPLNERIYVDGRCFWDTADIPEL